MVSWGRVEEGAVRDVDDEDEEETAVHACAKLGKAIARAGVNEIDTGIEQEETEELENEDESEEETENDDAAEEGVTEAEAVLVAEAAERVHAGCGQTHDEV